MKPTIPNVLAGRYASASMTGVWSPEAKIVMERRLWLAVAAAQVDLGLDIPAAALDDYRRVIDQVDLASIAERERGGRFCVRWIKLRNEQRLTKRPNSYVLNVMI